MESRAPLPPFTLETAIQKVRLAEDGWHPPNHAEFPVGRADDHPGLTELVLKGDDTATTGQGIGHVDVGRRLNRTGQSGAIEPEFRAVVVQSP